MYGFNDLTKPEYLVKVGEPHLEPGLSASRARFFSAVHSIPFLEKVLSDLSKVGQITISNFLLLQQYKISHNRTLKFFFICPLPSPLATSSAIPPSVAKVQSLVFCVLSALGHAVFPQSTVLRCCFCSLVIFPTVYGKILLLQAPT